MKRLLPAVAVMVGCTLNTRGELAEMTWHDASVMGGSGGNGPYDAQPDKPPLIVDGSAGKGGGSAGGAGGSGNGGTSSGGASTGGAGGQGGAAGCPGECTAGEKSTLPCGSGCKLGEQQVLCSGSCKWTPVGGCVATTECQAEGQVDSQPCGCNGQRQRTCSSCTWTAWSLCSSPAQCSAGQWLCGACTLASEGQSCVGGCWSGTCVSAAGACGGAAGAGGSGTCGVDNDFCTQQTQCCPNYYCNTHNSTNKCFQCVQLGGQCYNKVQCCSNQCNGQPGVCY